jgi:t-SNARE complex subunit (syntaxin)
MTVPLYDISTRLRDLRRISRTMSENQEQLFNLLDGLVSDIDNELGRQDSDRQQGVDNDNRC